MDMAFIKVLNMSISASWLVLVVLVLRFLLKKSPRWVHVALWALVAVRLVCPVSIESMFSLIPSTQTVPEEMFYAEAGQQQEAASLEIVEARPKVDSVDVELDRTVGAVQTWEVKWSLLWPVGMALMAVHALVSYGKLKRKVSASLDLGNGIYLCDYIDTPFILGIISPRIYLPSSMEPDSASHVLSHERAHIARKDHWWKPLGYALLTVHWFNPLLWLAYILLCRDIELACDEKVVRELGLRERKSYSDALLKCSVSRRNIAACPLAFGEVGVKERVKTVLNYKKPAFWLVLTAILALTVTAVCFLTDPVTEEETIYRVEEIVYRNPLLSYYMTEEDAPLFQITEDNTLLSKENDEDWVDLGQFSEIQLSDLNFDSMFFALEQGIPWEDAQQAWLLALESEETANSTAFYLLIRQEGGVYLGEGIAFTNVYPLHKHLLDATMSVNWLYRLGVCDPEQNGETQPGGESPYAWTSTVEASDICKAWISSDEDEAYPYTLEGNKLTELITILNKVKQDEIVSRKPVAADDPLWNLEDYTSVSFTYADGVDNLWVWLRFADDTVIIGTNSMSDTWKTEEYGYWAIENESLTQWMEKIIDGGTYMLSDENRDEIRNLVRAEYVQFFAPTEYNDWLFVGCAWDNGRGLGVAVYKEVAYGYKLLRLIRDEEVYRCASGDDLYYCDHNNRRIFLVMNDSVTGMEFDGAYEASYSIDTHPGLIVTYFPAHMASRYRFVYQNGISSTMYMDWSNQPHGGVPDYALETFENPDDAYSVCSRLKPEQVFMSMISEIVEVDARYEQAYGTWPSVEQQNRLLEMLNALPEDAYEPAAYPAESTRTVDIEFLDFTEEGDTCGVLTLCLHEGVVYYQFAYDEVRPFQTWKISDAELFAYLDSFFTGDISTWAKYAPVPKRDGILSFEVDGVEISTMKMEAFAYEFTDTGLRFKPEGEESWVELIYQREPLAVCGTGLKTWSYENSNYSSTTGYYDEQEYWSFKDLTFGDGEHHIVLLNEAPWVVEYEDEISWTLLYLLIT